MFNSSRGRVAASVLAALVIASACGGGGDIDIADSATSSTTSSSTTTTTTTTVPLGPLAPLTGLRLDVGSELVDQPAIMVKISNNDDQSLKGLTAIDQADVVIEERIEDRATRFAAIFHTNLPEKVGAVRSGRVRSGRPKIAQGSEQQSLKRAESTRANCQRFTDSLPAPPGKQPLRSRAPPATTRHPRAPPPPAIP